MLAAASDIPFAYATPICKLCVWLCLGLAGGSVCRGRRLCVSVFPPEKQGTPLGIFGAGNVRAAVTSFLHAAVLMAYRWQAVAEISGRSACPHGLCLVVYDDGRSGLPGAPLAQRRAKSILLEFAPLEDLQVSRFSLYYFFFVRRVRRPFPVAAALPRRRLWFRS